MSSSSLPLTFLVQVQPTTVTEFASKVDCCALTCHCPSDLDIPIGYELVHTPLADRNAQLSFCISVVLCFSPEAHPRTVDIIRQQANNTINVVRTPPSSRRSRRGPHHAHVASLRRAVATVVPGIDFSESSARHIYIYQHHFFIFCCAVAYGYFCGVSCAPRK